MSNHAKAGDVGHGVIFRAAGDHFRCALIQRGPERMAASIHACLRRPFYGVVITPVPSALVNSKRSPTFAPVLAKLDLDR